MTLKSILTALAVIITCLPGFASADRITCPLDQTRREITTPMPGDWWNTPIVNSLTETRVTEISGRPLLQCLYGPAGSIQRYAPDGQNCASSGNGFDCAPRAISVVTYSTGPLDIPQTWQADFDRGVVGSDSADIWFQAETADLIYLVPQNGARLGVGDRTNRGYEGCAAARFVSDRVSLSDIPVGSYICVRTNEGRISQFRVNGLTGASPRTLSLGYTTWQ